MGKMMTHKRKIVSICDKCMETFVTAFLRWTEDGGSGGDGRQGEEYGRHSEILYFFVIHYIYVIH